MGRSSLGATEVVPLPVTHGRLETIGFLFRRGGEKVAAYLPDCKTVSDEASEAIRGVGCLIIDALRPIGHPTHMNIGEAVAFSQGDRARGDLADPHRP